jgi:ATP-binding cassette subfamily F protein 3
MIRIDMQQKAFENQQDYIRQQERFIERFKAKASMAAQAQSVQKRLDKIDKIEDVKLERPDLRINFQLDKVPGKVLVELKGVSKSFGQIKILEDAIAEIERGDKIALIGANGKGKSTVLRMIAGTESFTGERVWGHNVEESFYAQHQLEALTMNNNILEELQGAGSKKSDVELRALLGAFLFSGDDVDKKVKVLSGGEKARVALAKTIVSKANFLILDEPTNHLDMHSVELLAAALNKYEGTMVFVSHDRYFISQTANKIWEIVDHKIKEFKGSYKEWVEWNERMARIAAEKQKLGVPDIKPEPKPVAKAEPTKQAVKENTPINREFQKELQKEQRRLSNLETQLSKAKEDEARLETALGDPANYSDRSKFVIIETDYKKAKNNREGLEKEYETAFEKVIELEAQA